MLGESVATSLSSQINFLTDDPTRPNDSTTWIYFNAVNNGERIKIGHSRQVRGKRRKQHSASHLGEAVQVDTLCEVRGSVADESALHRYFKPCQWKSDTKEIFKPTVELIEYVRWLRDQWFVVTPDVSNEERESMPVRDFSEWEPKRERRKERPTGVLPGMLGLLDLGHRETTGDDFYTNEIIIRAARKLMGRIDTDPASHAIANRVVQASRFYTIGDDGLTKQWHGKVWVNPPFSAWQSWVPKILREWDSGRIDEMCVLSAMRTVTAQYFNPLLVDCNAMVIFKGRIKFWGGKAGDSPDDGHAVFYFGKRREQFKECFSELGAVFMGDAA